jgi:hypothetical protein
VTKLTRTLARETSATVFDQGKQRPVIVTLEPGGLVVLRLKGTRRAITFDAQSLYVRGVKAAVDGARRKGRGRSSSRKVGRL